MSSSPPKNTHIKCLVCFVCVNIICEILFQAKHATANNTSWGVDGETGKVVDMKDYGIWEPFAVKVQTYKTAIEVWN